MPRLNSTPLCGMGKIRCFLKVKDSLKAEVISRRQKIPSKYKTHCKCYPTCVSLSYNVDKTMTPFIPNAKLTENAYEFKYI